MRGSIQNTANASALCHALGTVHCVMHWGCVVRHPCPKYTRRFIEDCKWLMNRNASGSWVVMVCLIEVVACVSCLIRTGWAFVRNQFSNILLNLEFETNTCGAELTSMFRKRNATNETHYKFGHWSGSGVFVKVGLYPFSIMMWAVVGVIVFGGHCSFIVPVFDCLVWAGWGVVCFCDSDQTSQVWWTFERNKWGCGMELTCVHWQPIVFVVHFIVPRREEDGGVSKWHCFWLLFCLLRYNVVFVFERDDPTSCCKLWFILWKWLDDWRAGNLMVDKKHVLTMKLVVFTQLPFQTGWLADPEHMACVKITLFFCICFGYDITKNNDGIVCKHTTWTMCQFVGAQCFGKDLMIDDVLKDDLARTASI